MRLATAERAMVAAMGADPVRGEEHVHGLGDPRAVTEGLRVAALVLTPPAELAAVPYETAMPTELTFADVAMRATRWTRA